MTVRNLIAVLATRTLSRLTLAATVALVAIGGFTRGSGSGYGCADRWPLCEDGLLGGLLPRADYHMFIEWTHRWVAALVGVLAVATAVAAWRRHRNDRSVVVPAVAAVAVIGVQAWVGRQVVKGELDSDLVTVHLTISMLVVALITLVVVNTWSTASQAAPPRSQDGAWVWLLAVAAAGSLVLLLLGSYVHNLYVSGWPLVGNTLIPDLSNRFVAVHYLHRVLALVGLVYLGYLSLAARRRHQPAVETMLLYAAATAYLLNTGVGAAHVFTRVSSSLLVAAHLLLATVVWVSLVAVSAMAASGPIAAVAVEDAPRPDSNVHA